MPNTDYNLKKNKLYSMDTSDLNENDRNYLFGLLNKDKQDSIEPKKNNAKKKKISNYEYSNNFSYKISTEYARRYNELTALDNSDLCVMYQNGNNEALTAIVIKNESLIYNLANKKKNRYIYLYDEIDLVQIGIIGLIISVKKFDISYSNKFTTYCTAWINGIISSELSASNAVSIPSKIRRMIKTIRGYEAQFSQLSNYELIVKISKEANMTIEKIEEYIAYQDLFSNMLSLNDYMTDSENVEILDSLPIPDEVLTEELVEEKIISETIISTLHTLPDTEREIIMLKYGFKNNKELTLSEISDKLGMSKNEISKIEAKAIRKLKKNPELQRLVCDF